MTRFEKAQQISRIGKMVRSGELSVVNKRAFRAMLAKRLRALKQEAKRYAWQQELYNMQQEL